jgi:hypothetical protein
MHLYSDVYGGTRDEMTDSIVQMIGLYQHLGYNM